MASSPGKGLTQLHTITKWQGWALQEDDLVKPQADRWRVKCNDTCGEHVPQPPRPQNTFQDNNFFLFAKCNTTAQYIGTRCTSSVHVYMNSSQLTWARGSHICVQINFVHISTEHHLQIGWNIVVMMLGLCTAGRAAHTKQSGELPPPRTLHSAPNTIQL